ncbi:MAG: ADP-ribosylglycohydrolase family protein, partial [Planctomycetota bacterium]
MKLIQRLTIIALLTTLTATAAAAKKIDYVAYTRQLYIDRCKGAWAGQIIGCTYGGPYEFKSNGKPITEPLKPWTPDRVKAKNISHSGLYDDCYVETTFLAALEKHGLDITHQQAGKAFADTKYPLWHANFAGRANVRNGIMPPMSGHPKYNRHADDIDFQIESDTLGIICPGLPQECNRICDIFGRIMNYGDGLYGGMFVAGMYTAAYFEDKDVNKVIQQGLGCIPAESLYHKCISDVVRWHKENPKDWLATWKKIEEKWQDDIDCKPGDAFNIDAKINGAYIAMGLLYGNGDMLKTMEIATRCGQDADCNPSNAAGVLGCMIGFNAIGE